jgi:hypothetical protein
MSDDPALDPDQADNHGLDAATPDLDHAEPAAGWYAGAIGAIGASSRGKSGFSNSPSAPMPIAMSSCCATRSRGRSPSSIGATFADQTIWDIDAVTPLTSNYDFLIGYPTRQAQSAAVRTFLHAPIETARIELRRALQRGPVIRRGGADA